MTAFAFGLYLGFIAGILLVALLRGNDEGRPRA